AAAGNAALLAAMLPAWRAFRAALRDPARAQAGVLRRLLAANAGAAFLREHGLGPRASPEAFLERVPPRAYDGLLPWIERAAAGEEDVLCAAPVPLFQPSSGSAAATKLVPYPAPLRDEFQRALRPWLADMTLRRPALALGPAYWSVSPAAVGERRTPGGARVGFEDDAEYLGAAGRRLVEGTLAVPSAVRHLQDLGAWRARTLQHLLRARELRLLSVWSPTFLSLLLAPLRDDPGPHLAALRDGAPVAGPLPRLAPAPARAREVERALVRGLPAVWPRLALVSAWADGPSAAPARALEALLPGVPLEAKGLLATEAVVSIPFGGARPAAVRSHFLELELAGRGLVPLEGWREGDEGSVVVTTGGGLWRYRLLDRVRVTGFLARTPTLEFLGKEDLVLDRFGEKLHEGFAARVLAGLGLGPGLAFLAPDASGSPPATTLYLARAAVPAGGAGPLAARLAAALDESFHHAHCVRLGQLAPPRVYVVEGDAAAAYYEACRRRGRRAGDVKPAALSREDGWSALLPGGYVG
ncbi:MAG: GH3 auxin-responsive promoter family protein, partial [Anaeromyxobacter sp.]